MDTTQKPTTAGSLLEQAANAEMKIAGARRARGSGFEATAIGGRKFVAWSPKREAVFRIVERAFEEVLDPGKPEEVERVTESLGYRAVLTRPAVRDTQVMPLRQDTVDSISKVIAMGVARVEARNAPLACQAIVRKVYEEVEHLRRRVEAAVTYALMPSRILEKIDEAVHETEAGLAKLVSALRRLKGRAESEPTRIDQDLADSEKAVLMAEERLRVIAQETKRTRIFGVERAVAQMVREVQVSIPALTNERIAQMYLGPLRGKMPDVERAIGDRAELLETRLRAVREMHDILRAACAEELGRLNGRGRVQHVGAPPTEAARNAAVEQVVTTIYEGVARELRDLLVWKAPQDRILDEALTLVRDRVDAQTPDASIDDVLLDDADPEKVALEVDHVIRDCAVPVALEPGADLGRLREWRCRIIRVPAGSRVAQALIQYAGYRSDVFDWTGRADTIEVIVWQPGISLRDTRVFQGGDIPFREERADPGAPPIETLADSVLRGLTRRSASPVPKARSNRSQRRYGSQR